MPLAIGAAGMPGNVAGDTFTARDDVAGSCGGAGAPDVVYRLDVPRRSRFVASLDGEEAPHVLVLWGRCGAAGLGGGVRPHDRRDPRARDLLRRRRRDRPPRLSAGSRSATPLRDLTGQGGACGAAPSLVEGRAFGATTVGATDKFVTSCGAGDTGASGPDKVFKISLAARATVFVDVTAPGFDAAVALRKTCADGGGPTTGDVELACEADADTGHRTSIERALEAGTYWVVVDGQSPNDQGPFTIKYRLSR